MTDTPEMPLSEVEAGNLSGDFVGTAVVTGAAGFIGSHLVDGLLEAGWRVRGVDALTDYYSPKAKLANLSAALEKPGFDLLRRDLVSADITDLLDGADAVLHLAAEPGVRTSWGDGFSRYLERNVLATQRVLEAMSRDGVPRLVFASSSSVYGAPSGPQPFEEDARPAPESPYGLTKLAAEELVRTYVRQTGLSATILRYFTVYGPRQRPEMAVSSFISAISEGRPVRVFGDGEQSREFTFVWDVVAATIASLSAPPGTYNVGGGSRTSVNALISNIEATLGLRAKVRYEPPMRGDVRDTRASLSRAGAALGYSPKVTMDRGVAEQAAWSREVEKAVTRRAGLSRNA